MKRRKFLVGLGSAGIGGSALIGSSAFSQVQAHRSVTIQTAEDPDAYLGMDKCGDPPTPNSSYASIDDDGHLQVLMNPENPTIGESPLGQGVNSDSRSFFDNVFEITNQGKEPACIYIRDDDGWPTVPEGEKDAGERRVDFYLNSFRDESIVGEDNAIALDLGETICIGIVTRTFGLSEGDELLGEFDNLVNVVADTEGDCFAGPECPLLSGQYRCTIYEQENPPDGSWNRTGTRFFVTNDGPATVFDIAVADSPGEWREDIPIAENTTRQVVVDASVPTRALLAYNADPSCAELDSALQTWDEFKDTNDLENLTDWYETFGSGVPDGAPEELPDDLVVQLTDIPAPGAEPVSEPDETISDEMYPDMSAEAEAEGWITCTKEGEADE